jgi:hypothetical protein
MKNPLTTSLTVEDILAAAPPTPDRLSFRSPVGDSALTDTPLPFLLAERLLLTNALERTIDAEDELAQAAARRCLDALDKEIRSRECD